MTDFFENLLNNGELQEKVAELKAENERLKQGNKELAHYLACMTEQRNKANTCLQEIKGVLTALYMNNWLQMNETARKSIQLLQDLITKAESDG